MLPVRENRYKRVDVAKSQLLDNVSSLTGNVGESAVKSYLVVITRVWRFVIHLVNVNLVLLLSELLVLVAKLLLVAII